MFLVVLLPLRAEAFCTLPEDGTDLDDEDCDGSYAVRRDYVTSFETLADFTASGVSASGGNAVFTAPANPWARLVAPIPFEAGRLTVGWDVESPAPGAACLLTARSTSMATTTFPMDLAPGYHEQQFPLVQPGDDVDLLRVDCNGSGLVLFDWLTLQNGSFEWAPLNDVSFTYSTMGYPGGGGQTFVRLSDPYDGAQGIILMGSDVGGLAWTEAHDPELEATEWHTVGGRWDTSSTAPTTRCGTPSRAARSWTAGGPRTTTSGC